MHCTARILVALLACSGYFVGGASVGQVGAAEQALVWRSTTTEHFVVQGVFEPRALVELGRSCETLLTQLRGKWFDDDARLDWSPRCLVVVHGGLETYLRDVPGGEQTLGSSWIQRQKQRIITRRIDIRGDRAGWFDGALAHELIHVLLADRLGMHPPLRWAEEGLAILADPEDKQVRHEVDFRTAAARGKHFRLAEILAYSEYPDAARITAFYGQSASLVRFLTKFRTPADFTAFLEHAASYGYDAALRHTYDIDGVADLERRWLAGLHSEELAVR